MPSWNFTVTAGRQRQRTMDNAGLRQSAEAIAAIAPEKCADFPQFATKIEMFSRKSDKAKVS